MDTKSRPHRLLVTPRSPFGRRARLAMLRSGLAFREEMVDPFQPTDEFLRLNPLGRVPVLVRPEGDSLIDSLLILDYLDETVAPIWPRDPRTRHEVRAVSAFCAGAMEAGVAYFFETQRGAAADAAWLQDHQDAAARALAEIERRLRDGRLLSEGGAFTQAGWDLSVVLEYLDLRMPQVGWREAHPGFLPILGEARASRFFTDTSPPRS